MFDQGIVRRTALHLPHLATQNHTRGLSITAKFDASHIGAHPRLDQISDLGCLRLLIDVRVAIDLGKGITFIAQPLGDVLTRSGHQGLRKGHSLTQYDQRFDLFFGDFKLTRQVHLIDRIDIALIDIYRDVDRIFSGIDGNLRARQLKF